MWRRIALAGALVLVGCAGGPVASPATSGPPTASDGSPVPSASPSPSRTAVRPLGAVEGAPLGYLEYLPPGYGDGELRPLLVFLHGVDENGPGSERSLERVAKLGIPNMIASAEWPTDRPFIVLSPQYGPASADECNLAADIDSFLEFAVGHYDVDPARVYLTGISCGAIGGWDYLATHADEHLAGAVLISAHAVYAWDAAGCELGRVPVWAFHGDADEIVPTMYIADPIADIQACSDPAPVDVRLTVYPDADHDAWSRTYDLSAGHDVYAWLLEHERS